MAYLWCTKCATPKINDFESSIMQDGESVVLTMGKLFNDEYRCDSCNVPLRALDHATLCEFLPAGYSSSATYIKTYFGRSIEKQKIYK